MCSVFTIHRPAVQNGAKKPIKKLARGFLVAPMPCCILSPSLLTLFPGSILQSTGLSVSPLIFATAMASRSSELASAHHEHTCFLLPTCSIESFQHLPLHLLLYRLINFSSIVFFAFLFQIRDDHTHFFFLQATASASTSNQVSEACVLSHRTSSTISRPTHHARCSASPSGERAIEE